MTPREPARAVSPVSRLTSPAAAMIGGAIAMTPDTALAGSEAVAHFKSRTLTHQAEGTLELGDRGTEPKAPGA